MNCYQLGDTRQNEKQVGLMNCNSCLIIWSDHLKKLCIAVALFSTKFNFSGYFRVSKKQRNQYSQFDWFNLHECKCIFYCFTVYTTGKVCICRQLFVWGQASVAIYETRFLSRFGHADSILVRWQLQVVRRLSRN